MQKDKHGWTFLTIIGEVGAGKSSIFNWMFHKDLEIGLG